MNPFVDDIMKTPPPNNWKSLMLDRYDGCTNSDEHMDIYVSQVILYSTDDAIMCMVFLINMMGTTLIWLTHLPLFSINCLSTLASHFGTQFATSQPHFLGACQYKARERRVLMCFYGAIWEGHT